MTNKSFLKGAIILGGAGILVKIMGAFFRIPLGNIIGDEGMGYYQASYPIYVLLLTISTAGVPTAISKLVSERNAMGDSHGAHRIFKVSFILLLIVGILTSCALFFGAGIIVGLIKSPGAYYSMKAIAPALLFVPMMAAYRGYFQGLLDMVPTAISQIIEQLGRTVLGLVLAIVLLDRGNEIAAAGASFGAAGGAICGALMIMWIYYRKRGKILINIKGKPIHKQETSMKILMNIFSIAIPITLGAAIIPLMNMIDVAMVMRRLQSIGFSQEVANGLYGQLTGMAAPLINLPQIITVGLAVSLVPSISAASQRRDTRLVNETIQTGVRVALLIGLPAAIGLVSLSKPIMLLLYPMQQQSALSAASSLSILGFGVIFITLLQTFTGILQGLGRPMIPVIHLFIGALIKILMTYVLTGIYWMNIKGAALGTVTAYGVAALLNFLAVKRMTKTKFNMMNFVVKPCVSVGAMAISVLFIYGRFIDQWGNSVTTVIAIAVGGLIYGLMLLATGGIKRDDFEWIPGGGKIARLLTTIGMLKK